jgi:hypothetical protein
MNLGDLDLFATESSERDISDLVDHIEDEVEE